MVPSILHAFLASFWAYSSDQALARRLMVDTVEGKSSTDWGSDGS